MKPLVVIALLVLQLGDPISRGAAAQPRQIALEEARKLLAGERKEPERAKKLLLAIADSANGTPDPGAAFWACIYLGYIEDRAKNRDLAIGWYTKALALNADERLDYLARFGLKQPMTWLQHLDDPSAEHRQAPPGVAIRNAYVTGAQMPTGLVPVKELSADQRRENFESLWEAIDQTYAGFQLKSIDWAEVHIRYRQRLQGISRTPEFYELLRQMLAELKDTHSWIQNYPSPTKLSHPGLAVDLFEERAFVTTAGHAAVQPGAEILEVDGATVGEAMNRLRPSLPGLSSDRAFRREAARRLLAGEHGGAVTVKLRSPQGTVETVTLKRDNAATEPGPGLRTPVELTRQRCVHFGRHASGFGYIRVASLSGAQEIDNEFDTALESVKDAPGLILDIRDNPGGFGHPAMAGRFVSSRRLASIAHIKNGPGHGEFWRHEFYLEPSGKWQYTRPVALLVNDVTGSAADLFATWVRSAEQTVTIGSTTHGNLSGTAAFVVLPCGLIFRISNAYVSDARDRPIEFYGNQPDIVVTPTISDHLAGRDPVFDKAITALKEKLL